MEDSRQPNSHRWPRSRQQARQPLQPRLRSRGSRIPRVGKGERGGQLLQHQRRPPLAIPLCAPGDGTARVLGRGGERFARQRLTGRGQALPSLSSSRWIPAGRDDALGRREPYTFSTARRSMGRSFTNSRNRAEFDHRHETIRRIRASLPKYRDQPYGRLHSALEGRLQQYWRRVLEVPHVPIDSAPIGEDDTRSWALRSKGECPLGVVAFRTAVSVVHFVSTTMQMVRRRRWLIFRAVS